jgi:SNF2 family DNA or RNA helicase
MAMKARPCRAIILPKDHFKKKEDTVEDLEEDIIPAHTLNLPDPLKDRLYEHQKIGLDWLFRANRELTGGILGDDMGLGKTFQVTCLLCGLFRGKEIQRVLIVSPVSVIQSWSREIMDHLLPYVSHAGVHLVTSDLTKKKREKLLRFSLRSFLSSAHSSVSVRFFIPTNEALCSLPITFSRL